MNLIYTFAIRIFGLGVRIVSSFNPKAKLWADGRKDWKNKMKNAVSPEDKVVWIHCSSLGEFEQGRPLMERIKKDFPNHKLAVSFFSPSGYEVRKNYKGADYIFYLPLDTPENAKNLIQILHPEILILVKYEYWFNLLKELHKNNIPVIVISAVIKENNIFMKSYGGSFRKIIKGIDRFFVQNEISENLLNSIGINNVTISGDTRFDRVKEIRESHPQLDFMDSFKGDKKLIVAGSSWPDDEDILIRYINEELDEEWKVIFAPHNIDDKQISQLAERIKKPTAIFTQSDESQIKDAQVLIIDTIGILTKVYAYSDFSYVGGGYTKTGIHNSLEPAVFGVPIIFGPSYDLYFEAIDLLDIRAAISFKNYNDFKPKMTSLINDESFRKEMGNKAWDYIREKPNATKIIMKYLKEKIK